MFFFADSANIGLTSHLARQVVDMYDYGREVGFDTYCVSEEGEQNEGLWRFVEDKMPGDFIIRYNEIDLKALKKSLSEKIGQYDLSVVHFQGFNRLRNIKDLLKGNVRSVITINSFPVKPYFKKYAIGFAYYWYARKYADKLIFLSPFALRRFVGSQKLMNKGKIVHLPLCIPQNESAERYDMPSNSFNIVYLANFLKNKGHEKFFPSIEKFARKYENVHFWLFGDGPRRDAVLKLISDSSLESKIHCPGRVDRKYVPSILKQSQTAMILSHQETGGHAFIEPIMYGCPVIGSRVGYAEYLIQDYMTSLGVDMVESLYNALEYSYRHPLEMKAKAEKMNMIVDTVFDYEAMIKAYYELYDNL